MQATRVGVAVAVCMLSAHCIEMAKIHLSAYLNSFREYTFHHCAWITECFVVIRALRSYTLISMLLNVCKSFHHLLKHGKRLQRYNYDFRKLRETGLAAFFNRTSSKGVKHKQAERLRRRLFSQICLCNGSHLAYMHLSQMVRCKQTSPGLAEDS